MSLLSLFTGIGGFDLAADRVDIPISGHAETDQYANQVLQHHWPTVPNFGDVTQLSAKDLHEQPTIICGGFPCQDLSVAGQRNGLDGHRSGLWFEFRRIVDESRPEWVIIENVAGLLSSNRGADFDIILQGLENMGYAAGWRVLDAQWFGVPQRRRRVFIIGHSRADRVSKVLFESQSVRRDSPTRQQTQQVTSTFTASSFGGGGADDNNAQAGHLAVDILQDPVSGDVTPALNTNMNIGVAETVNTAAGKRLNADTTFVVAKALLAKGQRFDPETDTFVFAQHQRDEVRELKVAGALAAQPGIKQQTFLANGLGVRRLTPLECERLQGFPDNWTAGHSDTQRYKMIGNAVAVPVVEWLLRRIHEG